MKTAILDTSFILSSIRNKIDFFDELEGTKFIIPKKVMEEIERKDKTGLALQIIKKHKITIKDLGNNHADKQIIKYAKEHPKILVATLDREIKKAVKNSKIVIREKKRVEII
jgi:rRNA-processing protein FCF1